MSELSAPVEHHSAPPAPRGRTLVLVALTMSLSVFLAGWADPEEELVTGTLTAPTTDVRAGADGRVEEWLVQTGKSVEPHDRLLVLLNGNRTRQIAEANAEIARLEAEESRRSAQAEVDLAWRLRALDGEILTTQFKTTELLQQQYDQKIEWHAWRDVLQKSTIRTRNTSPDDVFRSVSLNIETLHDSRLDAMRKHETARNATEVARVQLALCENRLLELRKLRDELPDSVRRAVGVEETRRKIALARELLKQLEALPERHEVRAPRYGRVESLLRAWGSAVKNGDALVRLIDDARRFLSVPVPPEKLAQFAPGTTVHLRFPGDQRRTGKVVAVKTPATPDGLPRIVVQPAGRLWPQIPLGSAVQVVVPRD